MVKHFEEEIAKLKESLEEAVKEIGKEGKGK